MHRFAGRDVAGFRARYQLAAWNEFLDAECVAIYDRDRSKALQLAEQFGIKEVPTSEEELFQLQSLDFVDVILTDIGTHILDTARFLFGEVAELQCQTRQIHHDIAGEDVATVLMRMRDDAIVVCNMSYASCCESDLFPQTFVSVGGTRAGVSLGADYRLSMYDKGGVTIEHIEIPKYRWANPAYELVHASIVACHQNLLSSLQGTSEAETTGQDNLRTLQLVDSAYRSAKERQTIEIGAEHRMKTTADR